MRTTTASSATAMLGECRNGRQRQRAHKHGGRSKFQKCVTLEGNIRRVLLSRHTKLLRGLGHFVSLHPTGRLKGDSTFTTASPPFYTIRRVLTPTGYFTLPSFYKSPAPSPPARATH